MVDVKVVGPKISGEEKILTPEALAFVEALARNFSATRADLLKRRQRRQKEINKGVLPEFPAETAWIREKDWKVDPVPADLQDRRVEITGPASVRKMVINALNSGARCYMADAEDSESPTWANIINGQINLYDAIRRQIDFTDEKSGKEYKLNEKTAVLMFRPRGWHLPEKHILVGEEPISASLFDFGMYFFHNAKALRERGTGVYLYLPKTENRHEARLWRDVFDFAESWFRLPTGSIRATVLIETALADFEKEEILYEGRHHFVGLNVGRWDRMFGQIKTFSKFPKFGLPDRSSLDMSSGFLAPSCDSTVRVCHQHGAYAMGGMSAQSPVKDEKINQQNRAAVRADALREAKQGFDGKWVSHPAYVQDATEVFDEFMPGPNQLHVLREDVHVTAEDLMRVPDGPFTVESVRVSIRTGIQYLEAWLRGIGCVQLMAAMFDAAIVEIDRVQVWQRRRYQVQLSSANPDGHITLTDEVLNQMFTEEMNDLRGGKFELAEKLFRQSVFAEECPDFLMLAAYDELIAAGE